MIEGTRMSYKPKCLTPCRLIARIDPTDVGSIMAGQGSLTVQAIVEWDSQEGKERPENGELCVETRRLLLSSKRNVRQTRAAALLILSHHFHRMALDQRYLDQSDA